jgi:hypothetical protein
MGQKVGAPSPKNRGLRLFRKLVNLFAPANKFTVAPFIGFIHDSLPPA